MDDFSAVHAGSHAAQAHASSRYELGDALRGRVHVVWTPRDPSMIRVLLCAEQPGDRALTEGFLGEVSRRYQVDWAPTYAHAQAMLRARSHHVCLVDTGLGMDRGFDLLHALVAAGNATPLVLLIAKSDPTLEAAALRAGAAGVLVRDEIDPKLLERTIRHAFERARTGQSHHGGTGAYAVVPNGDVLDQIELALVRSRRNHTGFAVAAVSYEMATTDQKSAEHVGAFFYGTLVERIRACVGGRDAVLRSGRHELIVVLESLYDARAAAESAGRILGAMSDPISVQGRELQLSAQIGVSVYPEHASHAESLLSLAREAMHSARSGSRSQMRVYGSVRPGKGSRRGDLRRAIVGAQARGELRLHYQPQVNIADGSVVGVEALMRWESPDMGPVPPAEFIPIAEEAGIIGDLGTWALMEGCRQAKRWSDEGAPLRVGINVSAQQFADGRLGQVVRRALEESSLPANLLELEITEGLLLENTSTTRDVLSGLRKDGVLIAVDDFGTGYASLSYVKRFPMDVIKIDREFVRNLPLDTENVAITSSIVALARSLGLEVIAEGVETDAEEAFLRALHCNIVQGYLHARPMPADKLDEWRASRRISMIEVRAGSPTSGTSRIAS